MSHSMSNLRRGNVLVITLVGVATLLALVVAGVWLFTGGPVEPAADAGQAVADKFLEQIRAGQAKEAWESTTAEFKSAEGAEFFMKGVKKRAWLKKPVEFASAETVNVQKTPRTEYVYKANGGRNTVRLLVTNEHGAAKIDRWVAE